MVQKASKRLYFLKQLKRAGLPSNHLFYSYSTVTRPVLDYCVPVWHYALTMAQTEQLKSVQKTAIHIILIFSLGMPYSVMLSAANLTSLTNRKEEMSRNIFNTFQRTSCLHYLLPKPRKHSITSRLMIHEKYPRVFTGAKRYCSFTEPLSKQHNITQQM